MLPTNLTTNEVKDAAGTEVEFLRIGTFDRSVTYAQSGEGPNLPSRLKVSHQETGSGTQTRRRSVVRFDLTTFGSIDTTKTVTHSAYVVLDIPIGNISVYTNAKKLMAQLNSFLSTTGAGTTVLFDGTGYGTDALVNGTL